jgi:hypothetical protein
MAASIKTRLPRVRLDLRITLLMATVAFLALTTYGAYWAITNGPGSNSGTGEVGVIAPPSPSPSVVPTPALSGKVAFTGPTGELLIGDMGIGGLPTRGTAGTVAHPSWAPGGDRVAFVSVEGTGPAGTPGDLNVLDVSKGSVTTVVRPSLCEGETAEFAILHNPRWWPDASAILYQEDCPDPVDSRLRDRVLRWHVLYGPVGESKDDLIVDLSEFDRLLGEPVNIASFDISPVDGSLAFELLCRARNCIRLALLEPAGRARILKDPQTDESYGSPTWSPDGSSLAYYYRLGPEWHLRVWDLRSGEEIDLTEVQASKQTPVGYWAAIAWSPDGGHIAYQHQDAIWLIEAKRGAEPKLLGPGNYPSWANKGKPPGPIVPPALVVPTPTLTPTATATLGPTETPTTVPTVAPTDTPTPVKRASPTRTPSAVTTVYPFPQ